MAESMKGLKRTHRCTEVSAANIGEVVTVMGWVQKSRNKGGIIFVDLRDRSGILQIMQAVRLMPIILQRQSRCAVNLLWQLSEKWKRVRATRIPI